MAEAETLPPRYYDQELRLLICPSDATPPNATGDSRRRSYEVDPNAACRPLSWLLNPVNSDLPLIYECEDSAGSVSGDCPGARAARGR